MLSKQLPFIKMDRTAQVLVAVWLVIAVFVAYLITGLVSSRQSMEQRVHDQAKSYARMVEEHAEATFDRANIALMAVTDHLTPLDLAGPKPARRVAIEKLLRSQLQRTPGIVAMLLTNAEGLVLADPLGVPPGTSVSDRQYFQTLQQSTQTSPVISHAIRGRISGKWGVRLGRRVDLPDGSFGGMISANLGMNENFTDFYSTLSLGENGAVSLRDPDDRLLVRHPVIEEKLGKLVSSSGPIKERLQAGDAEGLLVSESAIDHIERVFAFRRLKNYPIYAAVGLSLDDALIGWRRDRDIAAVGALLVILAGGYITVVLRRKQRTENQLRTLAVVVESSQDAIATATLEGNITSWNAGAQDVYGYSAEEVIGRNASVIVPPERRDEFELLIENCRAGRSTTNLETIRVRKDGRRIFVSLTASPIGDGGSRIAGYSVIARDITENKQMETQIRKFNLDLEQQVLERTAQLRALSKELAMAEEKERRSLSQDLHDDLGQILAMVKLKLTSLEDHNRDGDLRRQVREVEALVDQANRSVRSLSLQLSPPVLHQFGLVPALEWLSEELHLAYGLSVHVSDDGQAKPLSTEASNMLFRSVRELLINVHKHAQVGRADVDISAVSDVLVLSVTDSGAGFDAQKKLAPSAEGGFGLFSVRERISYIGGEMQIDSHPGDGTVVVLTLPLERRTKERMANDTTAAG